MRCSPNNMLWRASPRKLTALPLTFNLYHTAPSIKNCIRARAWVRLLSRWRDNLVSRFLMCIFVLSGVDRVGFLLEVASALSGIGVLISEAIIQGCTSCGTPVEEEDFDKRCAHTLHCPNLGEEFMTDYRATFEILFCDSLHWHDRISIGSDIFQPLCSSALALDSHVLVQTLGTFVTSSLSVHVLCHFLCCVLHSGS